MHPTCKWNLSRSIKRYVTTFDSVLFGEYIQRFATFLQRWFPERRTHAHPRYGRLYAIILHSEAAYIVAYHERMRKWEFNL